jgi:hypothetical protein
MYFHVNITEEMTEGWRKYETGELLKFILLRSLYYHNQIKMDEMTGNVARIGEMGNGQQEFRERNNHLLSLDATRTAWKTTHPKFSLLYLYSLPW